MSSQPRPHGHSAELQLLGARETIIVGALISQIIRTGETQVWFLAEHPAATPAEQA